MNWRNPHPLKIAAGVFALACLVAGIISLAHCQDAPLITPMQDSGLRAAEEILLNFGHEMKAAVGKVVGTPAEREAQNATAFVIGQNHRKEWHCYVIRSFCGLPIQIKLYPAADPRKVKKKGK